MTAASNGPTAPWKLTWTPPGPDPPAPLEPALPLVPAVPVPPNAPAAPVVFGCGMQLPSVIGLVVKRGAVTLASRENRRSVPVDSVGAASTGTTHENFAASPV